MKTFHPGKATFASLTEGLACKLWECFRRNEKLHTALKDVRMKTAVLSEEDTREANLSMLYLCTAFADNDGSLRGKNIEELSWPELLPSFQAILKHLTENLAPLPKPLKPPITREFFESRGEKISDPELIDAQRGWLLNVPIIWENWHVIAVPKVIFHSKHERAIYDELKKIVGHADKHWSRFKSTGTIFGSARQWDIYLLVEELRKSAGLTRGEAKNQAAWRSHDPDEYDAFGKDRLSAEGKRKAQGAANDAGGHVETALCAIENAITNTFPRFNFDKISSDPS